MEPLLVFSLLLLTVLSLICIFLRRKQQYWEAQGIPLLKPFLFFYYGRGRIGTDCHAIDIPNEVYQRYRETGVPLAGMFMLSDPLIILLDLELIKHVLIKDFANFSYRGLYHNLRDDPLMGNLAAIDGPYWKRLRAKLTPSFTTGKMKFMYPTLIKVGEQLADVVDARISRDGVLDVKDLAACYTTDVIASSTLGIECDSLHDPLEDFRLITVKFFEEYSVTRDLISQRLPQLAKFLHWTNTPKVVTDFYIKVVRDNIAYREEHSIVRQDFLQIMIDLIKTESLTMEEIAAQVFVFVIAGYETTSTTMTNCLWELAVNEDIQELVREEIVQVLQEHDDVLTYDCLKKMTYLDQTLKETLRKHPIAPALKRVAFEDYKVPGTNFIIKANTTVLIPTEAIQHDPRYFPEPDKFEPMRFTTEAMEQRHPMTFLPFGDGPRNCIGLRFGRMQVLIGLVMLLRKYRFSVAKTTPIPIVYDKTILLRAPKGKVELKCERLVADNHVVNVGKRGVEIAENFVMTIGERREFAYGERNK
ncbi:probable cytochrome P450 6a13 [Ceratitis capitata]|uniref:probable cytochrome P450 6a13 n=1 Tax=Ceratitis capitata TaxID=7213 RepID=UPI000329A5EB|nr:probable cytochrome P450 6a13 [Ceratitis capitata]XP_012160667.1 probable cytochrome P450 6a13 [Ceratitis capitata]XP_012160668.1 probable cytochrome P450 6a13 [Ceratitis capitata]XP_020716722.1 probable cytochrome P450 6a13 [Ceratitis capitata]XP_020716723.1 probable cytochrome P450 6a13 [Ceratitis capitata]